MIYLQKKQTSDRKTSPIHKKVNMTQSHKKKATNMRASHKKRIKHLHDSDSEDHFDDYLAYKIIEKADKATLLSNTTTQTNSGTRNVNNKSKNQGCDHCSMYCAHSWFYNPQQDLLDIEEQIELLEREIERTKQHKKLHETFRFQSRSTDATPTLYFPTKSDFEPPIFQNDVTNTFSSPLFPLPEDLYQRKHYHNMKRRATTESAPTQSETSPTSTVPPTEQSQEQQEEPTQGETKEQQHEKQKRYKQHASKQQKRKITDIEDDEDSLTEDDDEMLNHKKQRVYYQLQVDIPPKMLPIEFMDQDSSSSSSSGSLVSTEFFDRKLPFLDIGDSQEIPDMPSTSLFESASEGQISPPTLSSNCSVIEDDQFIDIENLEEDKKPNSCNSPILATSTISVGSLPSGTVVPTHLFFDFDSQMCEEIMNEALFNAVQEQLITLPMSSHPDEVPRSYSPDLVQRKSIQMRPVVGNDEEEDIDIGDISY